MQKKATGAKRLILATSYSLKGLVCALKQESAFRQEFILFLIALVVVFLIPFSWLERVALITSILFVMIVELINSAIECAIDRISLERHILSGRAKDYGSAAVLLSFLIAVLIWIAIFIRHFYT